MLKPGDLVRINLPGRLKQVLRSGGSTPDGSLGTVISYDPPWVVVMVDGRCSGYTQNWVEAVDTPP